MIIVIVEVINVSKPKSERLRLLGYATVKRWMLKLRKKAAAVENGVPKATKELALAALDHYCSYWQMTPDEIIRDAKKCLKEEGSTQKHDDMLDQFWAEYSSRRSATTAGVYFKYIRSFYRANGVILTTEIPQIPQVRQKDLIPTTEQIRRMIDLAPPKHRSWMILLAYTGLRIGAIPEIKVKDLNPQEWHIDQPIYPLTVRQQVSGTYTYTIWYGWDAKQIIESWVKKRGIIDKPEEYVWPYEKPDYLQQVFKRYAYRAGIIDAPNGLNMHGAPKGISSFRAHCLRKRLQTILERVGTPLNWVDYMLGHVPRGAQGDAYSRPTDLDLRECYLKALPELEIYGHHQATPSSPTIEMQKKIILDAAKVLAPDVYELLKNKLMKVKTAREYEEAIEDFKKRLMKRMAVIRRIST